MKFGTQIEIRQKLMLVSQNAFQNRQLFRSETSGGSSPDSGGSSPNSGGSSPDSGGPSPNTSSFLLLLLSDWNCYGVVVVGRVVVAVDVEVVAVVVIVVVVIVVVAVVVV